MPCPRRGDCRCPPTGAKGGKGTVWFPCPLLTPPNPPLRRDSLRSRGEMRGAHRDVWCSKGTPMIEAELFAGQGERPAPSGRALLCAASYARKIQGNKASKNLPDARNRAPVTPVSLHISDVSAQRKVRGVKRGQETIPGVLSPFVSAGRPRQSPAAEGGNFLESFIKALPEQRPCAPATESAFRSFAARFLPRVPVRRSTAPPCARW